MALHSSTLAWKIPWTEEPGGPQSMRSLRVGHNWATSLWLFTLCTGEGNGNPLQDSCLENPRDGGAWWAAINGVAQSRSRLKRLSSSSSNRKGSTITSAAENSKRIRTNSCPLLSWFECIIKRMGGVDGDHSLCSKQNYKFCFTSGW